MHRITDFLKKIPIEHHILTIEGNSYILMFLPYQPNVEEADKLFIDSYYNAFQKIREIKNMLIDFLHQKGFKILENFYYYKELALMTGKVKRLKNTLVAHPSYGSFFVIEVVKIKGDYEASKPVAIQDYSDCKNCDLCQKACPTNTIGKTFRRNTCIRELQNSGYIENETLAEACGKKILGCNICQLVCLANKKISRDSIDEGELLNPEYMFDAAFQGKHALSEYTSVLGDNYIRPIRLLALIINAMTNNNILTRYSEIESLLSHSDERVRLSSKRYIEKLRNDRTRN